MKESSPPSLRELAFLFLRLGATAFGGPAAHIAMMQREIVERRRWLTPEEFLDLLSATNLIPGPNSTEMAIHIGRRRAGLQGLVVAGTCFIVPAACLTLGLAHLYVRFGSVPTAQRIAYGIKPVMIAVVLQAVWGLGRVALKSRAAQALFAACLIASFAGANELLVLAAGGAISAMRRRWVDQRPESNVCVPLLSPAPAAVALVTTFSPTKLFLVFLKIGSILFGSGYVLLAYLRADFVERLHWLTEKELIDAIAVGQVTPGPVFSTATFIGYVLGGTSGAALATLGIFLPAFVFVALSASLVARIRSSPPLQAGLDGVNVASLALMAMVEVELGRAALVDVTTVVIAAVSFVLLVRTTVSSTWLVVAGALVGLVRSFG